MGGGRVGHVRAQPARAHLSHYAGGPQTVGARGQRDGTHAGRNQPRDEGGPIMKRLLERLRLRRSMNEEIEGYLEEKISDLMESGVPEAEARLRARREF